MNKLQSTNQLPKNPVTKCIIFEISGKNAIKIIYFKENIEQEIIK